MVGLILGFYAPAAADHTCDSVALAQDWSKVRRRSEEAFRKVLQGVLARRPAKRSAAELERIVRREARAQARRHVTEVRTRLLRECRIAGIRLPGVL
jgi:hypothetical protein